MSSRVNTIFFFFSFYHALCLTLIPLPFTRFQSLLCLSLDLCITFSSSTTTVYMHIYKSAHNWCLGKGKEQWGREAIRGIKRGAASQPSFTGQWSKSNWVLFCGRTHTHVHVLVQRLSDSGGGTQMTAVPLGRCRAGHV